MLYVKARWVLQVIALACGCTLGRASKVLVFTMPGMRSHHMNMVKLAHELSNRGHTVSMLVSSYDEIGQDVYVTRGFAGLDEIKFAGAPGLGTEAWASKLSRDSAEVCSDCGTLTIHLHSIAEFISSCACFAEHGPAI